MSAPLNFISWNVNGIRAILKKDFVSQVKQLEPDFLCLQETKAQKEEVKTVLSLLPEYKSYVNASKTRKGYSGTAILTRSEPSSILYDINISKHDQEGRVVTLEYPEFYLVTVYVPNSGRGLSRLEYRVTWDKAFRRYLRELDQKKPVIACGDFNVAHQSIDLANPKSNYNKTAGYTQQEIDGFEKLLKDGFFDTFRSFYPEKEGAYSYWSYMFNARENNTGWRIDYFLCSDRIKHLLTEATIYPEFSGSDHCPVGIKLTI
ncbi:MAG: exodeoxyribonuclease [Cyclobacteriaceae bacterium]|nr:MAG: exodeoxyribonuclease [Cyclobacteriaceae bacterium]